MGDKYLEEWIALFTQLCDIEPSESKLHVRLDRKPKENDHEQMTVRIRVASTIGDHRCRGRVHRAH